MKRQLILVFLLAGLLAGCASPAAQNKLPRVLVIESFLADITKNVAGDRLQVDSLIPASIDPHAFELTPRDAARIEESTVIISNGSGLETWLQPVLDNAGGQRLLIEASAGLTPRQPDDPAHAEHDPHFWLNPQYVIHYVENIRDGLAAADPQGAPTYAQNAAAYIEALNALDRWIAQQIETIPPERRLLVTNHESFGYYADRYGLRVAGTILTSSSSSAAPSAEQLANLVNTIKTNGVPAIFLETGTNPQIADQIALETGAQVITGLMSHSLSATDGPAATYIAMMRYNTNLIVQALR